MVKKPGDNPREGLSEEASGGKRLFDREKAAAAQGKAHLDRMERLAGKRLGELLVAEGLIGPGELQRALKIQAEEGGETVLILLRLGYIDVESFLAFLARLPALHNFDLSHYEVNTALVEVVPKELAERYEVFPIDREGEYLRLGVVRPLTSKANKELEQATGFSLRTVLCSSQDVRAAIKRYYAGEEPPAAEGVQRLQTSLRLSIVARLIREIHSLPALPETVYRVQEAMSDPKSSTREVADIVVLDPPVAAKVLSVANSAAYGFPRRIDDLGLAITLLGLHETYSIILSAAVLNLFEKSKHIDYKRFWIEAICCAAATRYVLKVAGRRQLAGTFAAGLLHDIGRVALAEVAPALYSKVDPDLTDEELLAAEEQVVGVSHQEAGYELALRWQLPPEIAEPIRFHHQPDHATEAKQQVAAVALAETMARARSAKVEDARPLLEKRRGSLAVLGIDFENAEAMLEEFLGRLDESIRDALT